MARPTGSRSHDYAAKRAALADRVLVALFDDPNPSLRALAEAAGVSRPTLLHYFGDREGAIQAALERAQGIGREHDPRIGAIQLIGPLQLALTRQHGLHGHTDTPLDLDVLIRDTVHTFVAAHGR